MQGQAIRARFAMRLRFLTFGLCMLCVPARADWTESGNTVISVATIGQPVAKAAVDIGPDDVVVGVRVGTAGASAQEGTVTVSGYTDSERYAIGAWGINNGTGNVQSTFSDTLACGWRGTVRANDSRIECGVLNVEFEGIAEIGLLSLGTSALEVTGRLLLTSADLSVRSTNVTTGSIFLQGATSTVDMNGGTWTNAGAFDVVPGNGPPNVLRFRGGAEFHQQGLARIAGIDPAEDHLVVTGDGTLLEFEEDLHLGEYFTLGNPESYPGTLTIADGATLVVHGTFQLGAQAVVNLEPGGTIYAAALEDQGGTINENGGTLVVSEPDASAAALVAWGSIVALSRRMRRE